MLATAIVYLAWLKRVGLFCLCCLHVARAEKAQNRAIETRVHHLRARSAMIIYLLLLHYYLLYFSHAHVRPTAAPASCTCVTLLPRMCAARTYLDERPDNLLHSEDERADGIIFSYFIVNEDDFRRKLMVLKYNGHGMCVGYQKISCCGWSHAAHAMDGLLRAFIVYGWKAFFFKHKYHNSRHTWPKVFFR